MNEFKKVVQQSNWGYWDTFEDGSAIEEREYVVRFPDGTEEAHEVKIKHGVHAYTDMGHAGQGRNDYAYINIFLKGAPMEAKLKGMWLKPADPFDKLRWRPAQFEGGGIVSPKLIRAKVTDWLEAYVDAELSEFGDAPYTKIGVALEHCADGKRLYIQTDKIADERRTDMLACKRLAVAACSRFLHEERQKVLALLPPEKEWE